MLTADLHYIMTYIRKAGGCGFDGRHSEPEWKAAIEVLHEALEKYAVDVLMWVGELP